MNRLPQPRFCAQVGSASTRRRSTALLAVLVGAALAASAAAGPARLGRTVRPAHTVVTVLAGYPTAFAFALSRASDLPPGTLTFDITDRGPRAHDFELCRFPLPAGALASATSCAGVATRSLRPGQSARLTITLDAPGRYEYLSTLPGQAAGGMRGLIGVGVALTGPAGKGSTSTTAVGTTCTGRCTPATTATSTGKPPALESLVGDPAAGAPLFAADCGSCHALAAAGTSAGSGPSLDADAPSQSLIVSYVEYGSDNMPAFGGTLTGTQINAIAAYVYASTHAG